MHQRAVILLHMNAQVLHHILGDVSVAAHKLHTNWCSGLCGARQRLTRGGAQGCEALIPGMKALIDRSAEAGVESICVGMPHRGARLCEVLCCVAMASSSA